MRKEKELAQWSHGSFSFLFYYGPCSPHGSCSFLLYYGPCSLHGYFSFTTVLAVRTAISPFSFLLSPFSFITVRTAISPFSFLI